MIGPGFVKKTYIFLWKVDKPWPTEPPTTCINPWNTFGRRLRINSHGLSWEDVWMDNDNIDTRIVQTKHQIAFFQSSYLSQISQIIFVEKKLSCGEILGNVGKFWEMLRNIGRFCHNLCAFMWKKIEPKKYICGEKWQIKGLHNLLWFVNGGLFCHGDM